MKKMKELQALINCNKVNNRTLQLTTNNYTITIIGVANAYYVMIENIQGIVFSDLCETIEEVYSLVLATEYNYTNEFNSFIN